MTLPPEHMSPAEPLREALVREMLAVALDEARHGMSEGGIPIGAALFHRDGTLLGRGHNRRVQDGDPSMHAETAAFRAAGGGATTPRVSWSPRSHPAGIAAGSCAS